ncbi:hypothetical protein [Nocardioides sp.]|uniref:hypothetical protein n=1 Tax=Nocardioides sp. TaxID=35761 RepID=UPI0026186792|nr:hypothetical protein [Nocardioides sp.]
MNLTSRRIGVGLASAGLICLGLTTAPAHADPAPSTAGTSIDLNAAAYGFSYAADFAVSPDDSTAYVAGYGQAEETMVEAIDLATGSAEILDTSEAAGLVTTPTGVFFTAGGDVWSWSGNSEDEAVRYASPEGVAASAFTLVDGVPVAVGIADDDPHSPFTWTAHADAAPTAVAQLTYVPDNATLVDLTFVDGASQPVVIGSTWEEDGQGGWLWTPEESTNLGGYQPVDLLKASDHQVLVSGGAQNDLHSYTVAADGTLSNTTDVFIGNTAGRMTLSDDHQQVYLGTNQTLTMVDLDKLAKYADESLYPRWYSFNDDDLRMTSFVVSAASRTAWALDPGSSRIVIAGAPTPGHPTARATASDPNSITVTWDADYDTTHIVTATPVNAPASVKPRTFTVTNSHGCDVDETTTSCSLGDATTLAAGTTYAITIAVSDALFVGDPVSVGTVTTAPPFVAHPSAFRITGTARVGGTLSIAPSAGAWARGATVTYTWAINGTPFATGTRVVLAKAQLGGYLAVAATGTLPGFTTWFAYAAGLSTPIAAAAAPPTVKVTAAPQVKTKGKTKVGTKLTVTKPKAPAGATTSYQWLRNGTAIKGATKATYKPTKKDKKKVLSVRVTVTQAGHAPYVKVIRVGKVS